MSTPPDYQKQVENNIQILNLTIKVAGGPNASKASDYVKAIQDRLMEEDGLLHALIHDPDLFERDKQRIVEQLGEVPLEEAMQARLKYYQDKFQTTKDNLINSVPEKSQKEVTATLHTLQTLYENVVDDIKETLDNRLNTTPGLE